MTVFPQLRLYAGTTVNVEQYPPTTFAKTKLAVRASGAGLIVPSGHLRTAIGIPAYHFRAGERPIRAPRLEDVRSALHGFGLRHRGRAGAGAAPVGGSPTRSRRFRSSWTCSASRRARHDRRDGNAKEIARRIVDRGADYVLALKGNQTSLHEDATLFFVDPVCAATCAREAEPTPATAGSKSASAAPPTQAGSSSAAPNGRACGPSPPSPPGAPTKRAAPLRLAA